MVDLGLGNMAARLWSGGIARVVERIEDSTRIPNIIAEIRFLDLVYFHLSQVKPSGALRGTDVAWAQVPVVTQRVQRAYREERRTARIGRSYMNRSGL